METKELICIVCPLGCNLEVDQSGEEINVSGNLCPRGKTYAIKELTNPTRIIPTTVCIKNGKLPRLPVKTSEAVPKKEIFNVMKEINKAVVTAPVKVGDIIIKDVLGLGVDIVATRSMDAQ